MQEPVIEYNEAGQEIHKDIDGYEEWFEYNEAGLETHYRDSNWFEEWREYNEAGQETHFKNSDGDEEWNEYDEDGKLLFTIQAYKNKSITVILDGRAPITFKRQMDC